MTEIYIFQHKTKDQKIVQIGDCMAPKGYKLCETKMIYEHKPFEDILKYLKVKAEK